MHWITLPFEHLSTIQLYDLLRLRTDVFVVEQQCPYHELDGHDLHPLAQHVLGYKNDKLTAYARILPPGLTYTDVSLGRVLTLKSERGNGLGHALVHKAIAEIAHFWPSHAISIGAQYHLRHFYLQYGFKETSAPYLDDGIEHIDMQRLPV